MSTRFDRMKEIVVKFSKVKAIEIFSINLFEIVTRQQQQGFIPWKKKVFEERLKEKIAAVIDIQRICRGFIGRCYCKNNKKNNNAVVIQCLFRKKIANVKIKQKKLLIQQQLSLLAIMAIQKFFRRVLKIRSAKKEVKIRRRNKAAIKIQKIARGNIGIIIIISCCFFAIIYSYI